MKNVDEFRLKRSGKTCMKAGAYSEPPQRHEMETRIGEEELCSQRREGGL